MSEDALRDLVAAHRNGVLATLRRDGRPQQSIVSYCYDRDRDLLRISITEDRAKAKNIRRDRRVGFLVQSADGWAYAAIESDAELWPVSRDPHDASVDELVDIYRSIAGEHDDWADYRATMVADRRVPLHLPIRRIVGVTRG